MSRPWQDAVPEWQRVMGRVKGYRPEIAACVLATGNSNMQRYFAWLAYEEKYYWRAVKFISSAIRANPLQAIQDRRNWILCSAAMMGAVTPSSVHKNLESWGKQLLSQPTPKLDGVVPWLMPLGLVVLWQTMTATGMVNPLLVPSPMDLVRVALRLLATGELVEHLTATLRRVGLGLLVGGIAGVMTGTILGMKGFARRLLEPLLLMLGSVPKVTLLPLVMLLLGINEVSRTAPVAASCFVILALHALDGVRNIDGKLVQLAKHYGAGTSDLFWSVFLPSILPSIFTGLRVATGTCLVVTISTELLGAPKDLGNLIWTAYQTFGVDKLYLGIVLSAALGMTMQWMVTLIRRKLAPWKALGD